MTAFTMSDILATFSLITCWTYCFVLVYYGHKFWTFRNEMLIIKRGGTIVIIIIICSIISLSVGYPFTIILYWPWNFTFNLNRKLFITFDILNDLLITPSLYTSVYLIALRYWLIYFDMQLLNASQNVEWKKYITSSLESLRKELWFIDNKKTMGNLSFMLKRITFIVCIFTVIEITLSYLYSPIKILTIPIYSYFNLLFFFLPVVFIIVIWRKIPASKDSIFLYKECKMILYWWISILFIYICCITLAAVFGHHVGIYFVGYFFQETGTFIIPFLSTYWVLKQFNVDNVELSMLKHFDYHNKTKQ
eukprot:49500_1